MASATMNCDLCGDSLIPNNIGRIIDKTGKKERVRVCKTCKEPRELNSRRRKIFDYKEKER